MANDLHREHESKPNGLVTLQGKITFEIYFGLPLHLKLDEELILIKVVFVKRIVSVYTEGLLYP